MRLIQTVFYVFLAIVVQAQSVGTITISPESTFRLYGTSNINHFSCELTSGFKGAEIEYCVQNNGEDFLFTNTVFRVESRFFDCGNKFLTRDLREAVKEKQFPQMSFEVVKISTFQSADGIYLMETLITIAGQANTYRLPYRLVTMDNHVFVFELKAEFSLSEFEIEPPSALMGLIQVNDDIQIEMIIALTL